jgi:tRNA-specific 2-thiouridylase
VEEKNYLAFIEKFSPVKTEPGPILHPSGKVIGMHKGIYRYTIGQRKGLGISSPEPLYVIDTDIQKNIVSVGSREAARKREFYVGELTWAVSSPSEDLRVSVKVRSTMRGEPATISTGSGDKEPRVCGEEDAERPDEIIRVVFDEPQWAPAPGQSAVFYEGDVVIGGGIIRKQA